MEIGYHQITLEKAKRLGTGIVPPLSKTLTKQNDPLPPINPRMETPPTKRAYLSIADSNRLTSSRTVGLSHKNANKTTLSRREVSRIFPMYGLEDERQTMKTTR